VTPVSHSFLLRTQRMFCDDNETSSQTPPPPPFGIADALRRRTLSRRTAAEGRLCPLPRLRGRIKQSRSRGACASELCHASPKQALPNASPTKGGGAPRGASIHGPRHQTRVATRLASGAGAASSETARLSALHRGAPPRRLPRPCFLRLACGGRYPPCAVPVQRCTSRAGHCAGRPMLPGTARERSYKPRPQEPHSLHQSAVTGRRP
jgi:hypothetical protein